MRNFILENNNLLYRAVVIAFCLAAIPLVLVLLLIVALDQIPRAVLWYAAESTEWVSLDPDYRLVDLDGDQKQQLYGGLDLRDLEHFGEMVNQSVSWEHSLALRQTFDEIKKYEERLAAGGGIGATIVAASDASSDVTLRDLFFISSFFAVVFLALAAVQIVAALALREPHLGWRRLFMASFATGAIASGFHALDEVLYGDWDSVDADEALLFILWVGIGAFATVALLMILRSIVSWIMEGFG